MKKILCTVLALALMLVLAACGGASSGASSPASAAPASSAASVSGEAASGAWTPAENVTMIVAYKAGSGTDNTARVLTAYAEKYVGRTLVIENLEGGSGSIGWTALAQADPDGYTIGFVNLPTYASNIVEQLGDYTMEDIVPKTASLPA